MEGYSVHFKGKHALRFVGLAQNGGVTFHLGTPTTDREEGVDRGGLVFGLVYTFVCVGDFNFSFNVGLFCLVGLEVERAVYTSGAIYTRVYI